MPNITQHHPKFDFSKNRALARAENHFTSMSVSIFLLVEQWQA
jgi:hypothetical protein